MATMKKQSTTTSCQKLKRSWIYFNDLIISWYQFYEQEQLNGAVWPKYSCIKMGVFAVCVCVFCACGAWWMKVCSILHSLTPSHLLFVSSMHTLLLDSDPPPSGQKVVTSTNCNKWGSAKHRHSLGSLHSLHRKSHLDFHTLSHLYFCLFMLKGGGGGS